MTVSHTFVPDTYIQKTKKTYVDSRGRRNLGSINNELQDVQRIMVANIEEVLQRGEAISGRYRNYLLMYRNTYVILMFNFPCSSRHKSQQPEFLV